MDCVALSDHRTANFGDNIMHGGILRTVVARWGILIAMERGLPVPRRLGPMAVGPMEGKYVALTLTVDC